MKLSFYYWTKTAMAVLLCIVILGTSLLAQDDTAPYYLQITKFKKQNDDMRSVEEQIVTPFVQARIKEGTQVAYGLFRVHYPYADDAEYDYVGINVFQSFDHLHLSEQEMMQTARQTFPNGPIPKIVERFNASRLNKGTEVFVAVSEAIPGPAGGSTNPPKFVQVNHMKVSEANSGAYAKMEQEIFRPVHQARIKKGKMHDWVLAQRIMPYGSEWDNNFLTFDIFEEWADMEGGGMGDIFAQVHPNLNADELWDKMAKVRELKRAETWELLNWVNTPTPEVTYSMLKEGTGPSPMKGQEVAMQSKLMTEAGETIFSTKDLGFEFYHILGSDPYDRFMDKGLMQMKKGGIITMKIPPGAQDNFTSNMTGGKPAVVKVELLSIAAAKPNGTKLLAKKIDKHGLAVAKEKYEKLMHHNPEGYVFREGTMNDLGYKLMEKGKTKEAIYVFKLNQKNYPNSWNACDSLADGYRAAGNYAKAKECYEKALKINPDFTAARDKLAKL